MCRLIATATVDTKVEDAVDTNNKQHSLTVSSRLAGHKHGCENGRSLPGLHRRCQTAIIYLGFAGTLPSLGCAQLFSNRYRVLNEDWDALALYIQLLGAEHLDGVD
jgi:hypothetical protein